MEVLSNVSSSRVESKLVLYGLLAGILSGAVQFVVTVIIISNFNNVFAPFSVGLTSNAFPSPLGWFIKIILGVTPFLAIVQYALYGAIFGVIAEVLAKAGLKRPIAAFVSGVLYFIAFGVMPFVALLIVNVVTGGSLLALLPLVPPATYLVLITLFSSLSGPWGRVFEKGPKYY